MFMKERAASTEELLRCFFFFFLLFFNMVSIVLIQQLTQTFNLMMVETRRTLEDMVFKMRGNKRHHCLSSHQSAFL